jgi:hypothetical protein
MSNIRTRLADAVSLAIGRDPFALCSSDEVDRMGELAASAVLSLPGIAIVELQPNGNAVAAGGLVEFRIGGGGSLLYQPDGARRAAAALLAAANAAEAQ